MQGVKRNFSETEIGFLKSHYSDTANSELAAHFGIGCRTLRRKAAELGLEKSSEYMERKRRYGQEQAAKVNRATGGNACKINLLKYGAAHRFKKCETNAERLGAEKDAHRLEKCRKSRNETIRKERMRIKWGLPQRTRLKLTSNRKKIYQRYALKNHGYIVERGASTIYYSQETRRSTTVETNAAKCGLIIMPYGQRREVI